ncbi:MAG TPA: TIM barrel protein [Bryobacteraceae bacterium]|nr:TIM barrel protein [Bryobacteraceae bacterium]
MSSYNDSLSRRSFLAATASAALAARAYNQSIPIGLELYSVRDDLKRDLTGTVQAVAKMGYQDVEFFSPYFEWTPDYARGVRHTLDEAGIRCLSTHNDSQAFHPDKLDRAIELNHILGCRYVVLAHPGEISTLDGYRRVAEMLNQATEKLKPAGLAAGYHNHQDEFKPIDGKRPMEVLASDTDKSIMLQLDVGTCIEAGSDPVAWIKANPGRIKSLHLKEWSHEPGKGYKVLFNEGDAPWAKIFDAAESVGGVEFYLIEQEGSDYPELETAQRCLASFRKLHAG